MKVTLLGTGTPASRDRFQSSALVEVGSDLPAWRYFKRRFKQYFTRCWDYITGRKKVASEKTHNLLRCGEMGGRRGSVALVLPFW